MNRSTEQLNTKHTHMPFTARRSKNAIDTTPWKRFKSLFFYSLMPFCSIKQSMDMLERWHKTADNFIHCVIYMCVVCVCGLWIHIIIKYSIGNSRWQYRKQQNSQSNAFFLTRKRRQSPHKINTNKTVFIFFIQFHEWMWWSEREMFIQSEIFLR